MRSMGLRVILAACLIATTFAVLQKRALSPWRGSSPWSRGPIVSRRDAGTGSKGIYQLVRDTLDKARKGMQATDLGEEAAKIQEAADAFIDANGGEAPAKEVQDVIDEIAKKFNGAVAVSALFDNPVTYQASVMDAAFNMWNLLVEKAEELEAAGQSPIPAIAAIRMTAVSIQSTVVNVVTLVTYAEEGGAADAGDGEDDSDVKNPSKRWQISGGINYGQGGWNGGVGFSHQWGRRRSASFVQRRRSDLSETTKRSAENAETMDVTDREVDDSELKNPSKRWQISGGINYQQGGWNGGVGFSHQWGKRGFANFVRMTRSDNSQTKRVPQVSVTVKWG